MFSKIAVATVLTANLVWIGVPAEAATPNCANSGVAYPRLESIERTSPDLTTTGRQVATEVSVRGGVAPVEVYVAFVGENQPFRDYQDVSVSQGTVTEPDSSSTTSGAFDGHSFGLFEVRYVALVDAADCLTYYHRTGTIDYFNSHIEPAPTHGVQLSTLSIEHVRSHELPPEPAEWTDAQKYMNALAQSFLGRDANVEEMNDAGEVLAAAGRSALTRPLAQSEEWAGVVVDDIYQAALDRNPEAEGRAYWVERLHDAGTTRDIAVSVYGSDEAVLAAGDAGAFVDNLYSRILGRSPEPLGRAFWVEEFESGRVQPWQLVSFFWDSIEFRRERVDTVYDGVLGRPADDAGREHWAGRLLVEDDVTLASLLASSDEFYDKSTY